jgi:hypothetical protein
MTLGSLRLAVASLGSDDSSGSPLALGVAQ